MVLTWALITRYAPTQSSPENSLIGKNFIFCSYYLVWGLFLFWIYALKKVWDSHALNLGPTLRAHWLGLLSTWALTALAFFSVPWMLRVLADDTNILSVSRSMVFEKRVDNITQGFWYYDRFIPETYEIDKRPLLFPFLIHFVHLFSGYRPANIFMANFGLLLVLNSFIYLVFQRIFRGWWWGIGAVLITLSQPLVSQGAAGGGLELCMTTFLFLALGASALFLRSPTPAHLLLLWATTLMLLHTRYEAIVLGLVLFGLSLLLAWKYLGAILPNIRLYALSAFFLLPIFWQRLLKMEDVELPGASIKEAFGWKPFFENHEKFFERMKTFNDLDTPMARLVVWAALLGLAFFLLRSLFRLALTYMGTNEGEKDGDEERKVSGEEASEVPGRWAWVALATFLAFWAIVTFYFFGKFHHPSSSRMYLAFMAASSLLALWLIKQIPFAFPPWSILALSASCFALYHPVAMEGRFTKAQELIREYRFISDFIKGQPDKHFLTVYDRPGMLTVEEVGALNFYHFKNQLQRYLEQRRNRLFRDIFIIQHVEYGTPQKVMEELPEGVGLELEILAECQCTASSFMRISRIK